MGNVFGIRSTKKEDICGPLFDYYNEKVN